MVYAEFGQILGVKNFERDLIYLSNYKLKLFFFYSINKNKP